jgi:RNA polymerase sigma-70 factor (ECF subfamily)
MGRPARGHLDTRKGQGKTVIAEKFLSPDSGVILSPAKAMPSGSEVTRLLFQWGKGDEAALDRLMPLVYRELHKMARRYMAQESPGHTLQTTAVIHEAYLKLAAGAEHNWESQAHFFGVAAKAMRHVLVDHARARLAGRRGGGIKVAPLDEGIAIAIGHERGLTALDDALTTLARLHPRKERVVELRYFAGLSVEETAKILNISPETVARDWRFARAFLQREMGDESEN